MKKNKAVVIGAGPAGLGAALALSRSGIEVNVFEAQSEIAHRRRGETIRFSPEMEALLGKGFFESQTIHRINKRRYYSHSGKKFIDRTISEYNLIIEWRNFVRAIAEKVKESGVGIHTGKTVEGIIIDKGEVLGIRLDGREYRADAVFSCGGIDDPASRLIGIDRAEMDRPVHKYIVTNYGGPDDRLEYHFHSEGGIVTGCIFPRGNGEAEIIISGLSTDRLPGLYEFGDLHHVFSERIKGVTVEYELNTCIPMGGMITECMPARGLFMAGDALGHVQARGGSGIRTSFLISYACGAAGADAMIYGDWERPAELMRKNTYLRSLRRHNLIYCKPRLAIFSPASDNRKMDLMWPALSKTMR